MRNPYDSIFGRTGMRHKILIGLRGLFYTIPTVHEPHECRLKKTIAKIRDAFEVRKLYGVSWMDWNTNLVISYRNVILTIQQDE